jgi:hypothetical protein
LVLEIFLGNLFGALFGKKIFFIQNKTVKIDLKVCLSNNLLGQKFLNNKRNQPNKALVLDIKKPIDLTRKYWFNPEPN